MQAKVERNKETGEFACIVGGRILAKGKSGQAISRLYDMEAAINADFLPQVITDGTGAGRKFLVKIGDFVFAEPSGAIKAYRILDDLEAALGHEVHAQPPASLEMENGSTITASGGEGHFESKGGREVFLGAGLDIGTDFSATHDAEVLGAQE